MTINDVKDAMRKRGTNAAALARLIGKSPNYLRIILRGEKPLTGDTAAKIADWVSMEASAASGAPSKDAPSIAAAVVSVRLPEGATSAHVAGADSLSARDMVRLWQRVAAYAASEAERLEATLER